jgi:hypothetical protein
VIVRSKNDRMEYCKWFLSNVQDEATSRDIASYMIEHDHLKTRTLITGRVLGQIMVGYPEFFQQTSGYPWLWSLKNPHRAKEDMWRQTRVIN